MGECIFLNRPSKKVLKSIRIATMPTKLDYITGETFDPAGMVVMAKYSFGAEVNVTSLCTYPATVTAATHTISYTDDGVTATVEITGLSYTTVSSTLSSNSWATIAKVAAAGLASTYWKLGASKSISLNGKSCAFRIIGFDHDNLATTDAKYNDANYNGGKKKAAITFEMSVIGFTAGIHNATYSNGLLWSDSYMRNTTLPTYKGYMPTELQNVLRTIRNLAAPSGGTSVVGVNDDLFLLSVVEIKGSASYALANEGTQYAYYKAGNSIVKTKASGISTSGWWTRSRAMYSSASNKYCYITDSGGEGAQTYGTSKGLSFAFCV